MGKCTYECDWLIARQMKSELLAESDGHIDAVSRRPAATYFPGAARVLFITTTDTPVASTTLSEANSIGVSIWQAVVCRDPNENSFQVSAAQPLNPGVYGGNVPISVQTGVKTYYPGNLIGVTVSVTPSVHRLHARSLGSISLPG